MSTNIPDSLIEIFHEEATEIVQEFSQNLLLWKSSDNGRESLSEIKRLIHTLKGSARLVKFVNVADFCHQLEDLLSQFDEENPVKKGEDFVLLELAEAYLKQATAEILNRNDLMPDGELNQGLSVFSKSPPVLEDKKVVKSKKTPFKNPILSSKSAEQVRVNLDVIEQFSKLASGTNISHSHLSQQQKELANYQVNFHKNLNILREQLKSLLVQADSNVYLQRQLAAEKGVDDYDLLEFDRYTHMQQLTRRLIETTSQIQVESEQVLKTISNQENILLAQKRTINELEEGLTHIRMVPFESIVPRLENMVSQISEELGKSINFTVLEVAGEMDKRVLESLLAPIEHMLRNAMDHGIESPEVRLRQNKPKKGNVALSLVRSGAAIIIKLQDDGKGIDLLSVKKKAIDLKLINKKDKISDDELIRFILRPGFSTREELTEISGRGIGMDVVNSEVARLGGMLSINTEYGVGTQFTIRLPFTLSLNKTLICQVSDNFYGFLFENISAISRVPVEELKFFLKNGESFKYANVNYPLKYLGEILEVSSFEKNCSGVTYLPVILIKAENYKLALIIDKVIGSREVVIKSLGSQLQFVEGFLGGCILGNGQVVLVLDAFNLTRSQNDNKKLVQQSIERQWTAKTPNILIVDDSVTVRKITSKLLTRNHFQTQEAKDGIEALEMIKKSEPDCILLDLEMPRMGGFEVIEHLKKDESFKNIPIIVISSRSPEKYKLRALQMGASFFLSKPFVDDELLELLKKVMLH